MLCQVCGESYFILPIDTYPLPQLPALRKPTTKAQKQPTDPSADPSQPGDASDQPDAQPGTGVAVKGSPDAGTGSKVTTPKRVRVVTLFRALVVLIVGIVVTTGYWSVRARAVDQASIVFKDSSERGLLALEQGKLSQASQELHEACNALDLLGRDDFEARHVRQMAREAKAATALASDSLAQIMQDVVDSDDPQQLFRAHYAGAWVIFDTFVTRHVGSDNQPSDVIDFPLSVRKHPVVIESHLPAFDQIDLSDQPKRVIFAAQLDSCQAPISGSGRWTIRLRSETAFLWTQPDTLQHLGLEPLDDASATAFNKLLQSQAHTVGLNQ